MYVIRTANNFQCALRGPELSTRRVEDGDIVFHLTVSILYMSKYYRALARKRSTTAKINLTIFALLHIILGLLGLMSNALHNILGMTAIRVISLAD